MGNNDTSKTKKKTKTTEPKTGEMITIKVYLALLEDAIRASTPPERLKHLDGFKLTSLEQTLDIYRLLAAHNRELELTVNDMQAFIDEHMMEEL